MKKESTSYKIFNGFNIFLMLIVAAVMMYPYLNVVAKAFNDGTNTMLGGLTIFPRIPTLENFRTILRDGKIMDATVRTVLIVVIATSYELVVQFSVAYALSRKKLPGRTGILLFLMLPMFIKCGLIPTYVLYSTAGLLNNFMVYILPGAFSFYNMLIIKTYMTSTISDSLDESAKLDGANDLVILFRIYIPLCKPILATVALWLIVSKWNDWITTLYFVNDSKLFTLQYLLMQVVRESERIAQMIGTAIQNGASPEEIAKMMKVTPDAIIAAQVVITTIPIIIIYPFLQKYFVNGIMLGAVKE